MGSCTLIWDESIYGEEMGLTLIHNSEGTMQNVESGISLIDIKIGRPLPLFLAPRERGSDRPWCYVLHENTGIAFE